jgi:hypothetical protein
MVIDVLKLRKVYSDFVLIAEFLPIVFDPDLGYPKNLRRNLFRDASK